MTLQLLALFKDGIKRLPRITKAFLDWPRLLGRKNLQVISRSRAHEALLPISSCSCSHRLSAVSLTPNSLRKVGDPHLAGGDHPCCRYLELLIVAFPLLGHTERLLPLTWCLRNHTLFKHSGPFAIQLFVRAPEPDLVS